MSALAALGLFAAFVVVWGLLTPAIFSRLINRTAMTPQQANELLPCAHCASEAALINMNASTSWQYWMAACECGIQYEGPTAEDCAAAWNRRAPAPTSEPGARDAVLHQFRTRPDWQPNGWGVWDTCTKAQHDEKLAKPLNGDWHYEVRALYLATPASPAVPTDPAPLVAQASPDSPTKDELWEQIRDTISCAENTMLDLPRNSAKRAYADSYQELDRMVDRLYRIAPEASPLVEDAQRIVAGINPSDQKV